MRANLLNGVRVVELSYAWAGPFAARLLADLGAEVVKVEGQRHPDLVRFGVFLDNDPGDAPWERGGHFQKFSHNKKSCILDITKPRGLELFCCLLERADVFIENNTPRVRNNLGLTNEVLAERFPNLITISMPGFGDSGPYRDYVAYGLTVEGFAGLSSVTGYADERTPVRSAVPYGDPVAGAYAAIMAVAGLRARRVHGAGSHVELSQHETLASLLPDVFLRTQLEGASPAPGGNDDPWLHAPHGAYPCREPGTWITIAVETGEEWSRLCVLLGRTDLQPLATHDQRDGAGVTGAIEAWTRERTRDEAVRALQAAGVAAGPVLSPVEMMAHEQVVARELYCPVEHPLYRALPYARSPVRFAVEEQPDFHGPLFGEHNTYVFKEILGLSDSEIAELYADQITANQPDMA